MSTPIFDSLARGREVDLWLLARDDDEARHALRHRDTTARRWTSPRERAARDAWRARRQEDA